MKTERSEPPVNKDPVDKFVEGDDYYFENGLMVLTERFLRNRGFCCESGCRHCPYGYKKVDVYNK